MIPYMTREQYIRLYTSGLLWKTYPDAKGNYLDDVTQKAADILTRTALEDSEGSTPSYYNKVYKGIKLDPYRIAEIYNLTDHALFQAHKKILVSGQRGAKDIKQDITEARDALNRKLEMLEEDNED